MGLNMRRQYTFYIYDIVGSGFVKKWRETAVNPWDVIKRVVDERFKGWKCSRLTDHSVKCEKGYLMFEIGYETKFMAIE